MQIDPTPTEGLLTQLRPIVDLRSAHPERRLGRALAFVALYESDQAHHQAPAVLDRVAAAEGVEPPFPEAVLTAGLEYARHLVSGVLERRREIDATIAERAPTWPLQQMSAIDRNVLRLGLYESLYGTQHVPVKAAINEAVELAKLFGSETSSKFVNGVLGRAVE